MKRVMRCIVVLIIFSSVVMGGNTYKLGLKMQKVPNLYYENGLVMDYSSDNMMNSKLHLSAGFVSSRLGSAMGSNALKQEEYLLSAGLLFRQGKMLNPLLKLNTGLFMLDTEFEIFSDLPDRSMLLSLEFGLGIDLNGPFDVSTSVGYNLISGNGLEGPGTLYPIFLNLTANYTLTGGIFK